MSTATAGPSSVSSRGKSRGKARPSRRNKSNVWAHFKDCEGDPLRAVCNYCKKSYSKGGGTTNLISHLSSLHPEALLDRPSSASSIDSDVDDDLLMDVDAASNSSRGSTPAPDSQPASPPSTRSSPLSSASGTFLQPTLHSYSKLDKGSTQKLNLAVAYFVGTCGLPFNTVTKKGFKVMMRCARPGYEPIGRKALVENYLPKLYTFTKSFLESLLMRADHAALTSDLWTSDSGEPFISLTVHFIGTEWVLQSGALNCRAFDVEHTAINIKDWFLQTLEEWALPRSKISAITTDNGDNMRLAVELLDVPNVRCLGHTIQTGMDDVKRLEDIAAVTKKTHALQQHFSSNKLFRAYKRFIEERYQSQAKKLTGLCPTRWWSELPLNRAIIESEVHIREFLAFHDHGKGMRLLLSHREMNLFKSYTATLDPLDELTQGMSSEKNVTASAILPIVYLLNDMLRRAEEQATAEADHTLSDTSDGEEESDPPVTYPIERDEIILQGEIKLNAAIFKCIVAKLHKRYDPESAGAEVQWRAVDKRGAEKCNAFLSICSFMDPRFRDDLRESDQETAKRELLDEIDLLERIAGDQSASSDGSGDGPAPKKQKGKGLAGIFAKLVGVARPADAQPDQESQSLNAPRDKIRQEIARYCALPPLDKDEDPLAWWKAHSASFPLISKVAKKYLSVPATSITPSERLFSHAGDVYQDTRHCLSGENAEIQIFLKMNQDLVPIPK
ncbi:E3 SUMO-protein ligase ZBED1 [Frankliniella fusca]|uniref:E3 SUMO-protein ligase ZBED1 n=1 Tax=Frankliniella fusca TaxID=407009 RepID=A0AAE1LE85_9NEOP|nr:E3 SUMO-protein ligase ZBED1 [Frankliniella fusca]